MTDTNKLNDAYLPAVVALALALVLWVFASTRLQVLGASLMTIVLIGLAVISWFIHRDKDVEKTKEDATLKDVADALGVPEEKAQQIAINRLHAQLFPGQEGTPEAFMQAGQPAPAQVKSKQTLDDLVAKAAQ
jgi:hypothetical protein